METLHRWTDANLDLVYLLYGLAFVVMGSILVASPREESRFAFGRDLRAAGRVVRPGDSPALRPGGKRPAEP